MDPFRRSDSRGSVHWPNVRFPPKADLQHPADGCDLDVVRSGSFAKLFVMDESGLGSQRYRPAVAEGPLAAVTVIRAYVAVDIESALVVRSVGA